MQRERGEKREDGEEGLNLDAKEGTQEQRKRRERREERGRKEVKPGNTFLFRKAEMTWARSFLVLKGL